MANPTAAAIAAIRARVTDWTQSDAAILSALNAADQPNPMPQAQVRKPMSVSALFAKVSAASRAKLASRPGLPQAIMDIRSQDPSAVLNWVQLFVDTLDLTPAEAAALQAEINATIPDPKYRAQLSWAEINLGRPVDAADLTAARP